MILKKIDFTNTILIDVRKKTEWDNRHINGAVNIPVDELRNHLVEIPDNKQIVIYCAVGLRGYIASCILNQKEFSKVVNLLGGYKTYSTATAKYSK